MAELSLPCRFDSNISLRSRAYYAIGGTTRFFARPDSLADLSKLLLWNQEYRLPLALMGMGSNIIFSDEPFPGVVLSLEGMQRIFWLSGDELFCEAGAENSLIAEELLKRGKSGGEWLYRLPGQIGSTVRMNARCFGNEVSGITSGILTVSPEGQLRWQSPEEVFYGYKHTSLMDKPEIVVAVVLRFPASNSATEIEQKMKEYEAERARKHHFDYPSCGSVFKNNYVAGRSSGTIFDELGFKGRSEGGAMVSRHHANFIFNLGSATARDVLTLASRMKGAAFDQAGVELELEVQCIGRFDRNLLEQCGVSYITDNTHTEKGWAGLLWHPWNTNTEHSDALFPRLLLHGPMVSYFGLDLSFPSDVVVQVEQLRSLKSAALDPEAPFLRWTTTGSDSDLFALKPPSGGSEEPFTDELWHYGVSELFIGRGAFGSGYLEFEMTPEGRWVALQLDAKRARAEGFEELSVALWLNRVAILQEAGRFGMELSYGLLQPFLVDGRTIALQCCGSSGRGEYGLFPWWRASQSPADFHQPDNFYLVTLI
jgi:UDP-N-acetylmuramate dehydrogenase